MKDQAQSFQGKFTTWAFKAGKLSEGVPVGAPMDISIPPPMNTPPPSLPGISQSKLALHTGQKNEFKKKVPVNWHELKSQKIRQVVEKSCDDQTNELANIKQELQSVKAGTTKFRWT